VEFVVEKQRLLNDATYLYRYAHDDASKTAGHTHTSE
jgi:hypothetical protein